MKMHTIAAQLEKDGDSNWYYVHIPKMVRDDYKALEKRGTIPVTITITDVTWQGSLLPWADGSAQISVPKTIRMKLKINEGDELNIAITPRERA